MPADVSGLLIDVGAFNMNAANHLPNDRAGFAAATNVRQPSAHRCHIVCDDGRQNSGHSIRYQVIAGRTKCLDGQLLSIEVNACVAVDLKIEVSCSFHDQTPAAAEVMQAPSASYSITAISAQWLIFSVTSQPSADRSIAAWQSMGWPTISKSRARGFRSFGQVYLPETQVTMCALRRSLFPARFVRASGGTCG